MTTGQAYLVFGQGTYGISSTLPEQAFTLTVNDGIGGDSYSHSGTTDASGNALGNFTVPDVGEVGYVDVTFASGTKCNASFMAEAPG